MTHRTFIEALGNGTAVAAWVSKRANKKIDREAVYKWATNGVPYRWRPLVLEMARERGVKPPKDLLPQ
jgi:hypothetical protein